MKELCIGFLILCAYFAVCALAAIICRKSFKIPDEIFRKILHFILLGSIFVFTYAYQTWWISVIACIVFIIIVYPILLFAEKLKTYSQTVTERKKGELKSSLVLVFLTIAAVITICRGIINNKHLVLAAILSWGIGDAFAALIGTKFGKHKIYKNKSLEGTLASFATSCVVVFIVFFAADLLPWYYSLITAVIAGWAVSLTELYTPNGLDTVTCPFAATAVIVPAFLLFGQLATNI